MSSLTALYRSKAATVTYSLALCCSLDRYLRTNTVRSGLASFCYRIPQVLGCSPDHPALVEHLNGQHRRRVDGHVVGVRRLDHEGAGRATQAVGAGDRVGAERRAGCQVERDGRG